MNRILKKFMPTRDALRSDSPVVLDLDRMISSPVAFRFMGKIHKIKPMNQETFFKAMNGLAALDALRLRKDVTLEDVRTQYSELFMMCIDTLSYKDVLSMTEGQIAALLRQIIDCVTGRNNSDDEKKNSQKNIQQNH